MEKVSISKAIIQPGKLWKSIKLVDRSSFRKSVAEVKINQDSGPGLHLPLNNL